METPKKISQAISNIWQIIKKTKDSQFFYITTNDLLNIEIVQDLNIQQLAKELSKLFIDELNFEAKKTNDVISLYTNYIDKIKFELTVDRSFQKGYNFTNDLTLNECLELNFSGLGNVTPFEFLHGTTKKIVMHNLKQKIEELKNNQYTFIQLKWNGDEVTVYKLMNFLVDKNLLTNSNLEISMFIKSTFSNFRSIELEDIEMRLNPNAIQEKVTPKIPIKLNWKGQKNQLYFVFRELKDMNLILNSYDDLAIILKNSIDIFEDGEISTIGGAISKKIVLPKPKRFNIRSIIG